MGYRKRFEDSYLDGEDEEFEDAKGDPVLMGLMREAESRARGGELDKAIELWEKISEIAQIRGDKNLYYKAMDKITQL